jgi:signal transduction histidine kinase
VRAIAEAHDGTATAENRPGAGARVTLVLAAPGGLRPQPSCATSRFGAVIR